jgi:uncharacterized surface protein with fasciclin (FAS1) repeats
MDCVMVWAAPAPASARKTMRASRERSAVSPTNRSGAAAARTTRSAEVLTEILTYHVVGARRTPADLTAGGGPLRPDGLSVRRRSTHR